MTALLLSAAAIAVFFVIVLAWLFRSSTAPLWAKVAGPSVATLAGCSLAVSLGSMLGYPVPTKERDMPAEAQLIAFIPHDDGGTVDLWLVSGDQPRAYEAVLTKNLKDTLREAQEAMQRGGHPMLRKGGPRGKTGQSTGDLLGIGDDSQMYVLEVEPTLPPKD